MWLLCPRLVLNLEQSAPREMVRVVGYRRPHTEEVSPQEKEGKLRVPPHLIIPYASYCTFTGFSTLPVLVKDCTFVVAEMTKSAVSIPEPEPIVLDWIVSLPALM